AAENFELSASSAVKWLQRWRDTGSARAKPSGGSTSPLEEHAKQLLALVAKQPDLTLEEIVAAMHKRRIPAAAPQSGDFSSDIMSPLKKACARVSSNGRTWPGRADAGCESKACSTPPGWYSSM